MVRAAGNAPACSCSRSRRLTFRLRSGETGRASGYRALYSGVEDRRVSLNTYARRLESRTGVAPVSMALQAAA